MTKARVRRGPLKILIASNKIGNQVVLFTFVCTLSRRYLVQYTMPPKQKSRVATKKKPKRRRTAYKVRRIGISTQTASGDDEDDKDYKDYGASDSDGEEIRTSTRSSAAKTTIVLDDSDSDVPLSALQRKRSSAASASTVQQQPCYLLSLPNELLQKILDYVCEYQPFAFNKARFRPLALVSEQFRQIIQPKLFDTLRISQIKRLYRLAKLLQQNQAIQGYTRYIELSLQCSLAEESNMVASAIGAAIPLCKNLSTLQVEFKAPFGYQVIFPILPRNFEAPSVECLELGAEVLTSSFMHFVSGFKKIKRLHLRTLSLGQLRISDEDLTFISPSVTTLILSHCIFGPETVQLLSTCLPNITTVSLDSCKGPISDLLTAIKSQSESFVNLSACSCTETAVKRVAANRLHLPVSLWNSLQTIRLLYCRSLDNLNEIFAADESSEKLHLRDLRLLEIVEAERLDQITHESLVSVMRLGSVLNNPPSDESEHVPHSDAETPAVHRPSTRHFLATVNVGTPKLEAFYPPLTLGEDITYEKDRESTYMNFLRQRGRYAKPLLQTITDENTNGSVAHFEVGSELRT
ncbi:hypothetical protein BZA70DRAFT_25593 [Myxozyma melibiosi]|uniref:F-box domain-containing protein n=1 Tax=Myxozyma melibiosi TaxID=54550 RepID=A0ABR1FD57_9ASCO